MVKIMLNPLKKNEELFPYLEMVVDNAHWDKIKPNPNKGLVINLIEYAGSIIHTSLQINIDNRDLVSQLFKACNINDPKELKGRKITPLFKAKKSDKSLKIAGLEVSD